MGKTKVHIVEVVPDADLRKKESKAQAVVKRFVPKAGQCDSTERPTARLAASSL
jgi:hypothetical protein